MAWAMLLAATTGALFAGCDSSGPQRAAVDGYWKGQMVQETITDQMSETQRLANERPQRILLRLQESEGVVQGRFASSSDVIAFGQIDNESSRRVSTYAVTGTLDGSQFHIRFSAEAGQAYQVDAVVDERVIAGHYVSQQSTDGGEETSSGRFNIERY